MKRQLIESFCEDIKREYCLFLYNNNFGTEDNPKFSCFPYCCKLSADIVTSYFKLCFGEEFKYICTTNTKVYNHAWTLYKSDNEEFIVDFTDFQHEISNKIRERLLKHEISIDELLDIIGKINVVMDVKQSYCYPLYDIMCPKEQVCIGANSNKVKDTIFNKEDFLNFAKKVSKDVYNETGYY